MSGCAVFESYPTHDRYRALRLTDPPQIGPDVYALQHALNSLGWNIPLTPDGVLGVKTSKTIVGAQRRLGLLADGIAGQITQRTLALKIGKDLKSGTNLPAGLPGGQLAHESSFILGNYSPQRPDGNYDAGVAQRNTAHTPPKEGFDPVLSIQALIDRVTAKYAKYDQVSDERRRWELAVGSWNAPAFTDYLAGEGGAKPSDASRALLESYIDSCTAYMQL